MRRLFHKLRGYLPRRGRRAWRYVSGRRRGVGLVAFACLVLVAYGYWYETNDAHVKEKVVAYLSSRTGGRVELEGARFSLFEGITVSKLRVYLSDEVREPFFEAPRVLLKHRPSGLLFRGRLEPTELVCVQPRVTLIEDVETGQLNVMGIFLAVERSGRPGRTLEELPEIRLRDGELSRKDRQYGQVLPVGQVKGLNVALLPDPEKLLYHLRFEGPEEGGSTMRGSGTIDLVSGETHIKGLIGLARLDDALPRRYRKWRQRYGLTGSASWATEARVGVASASAPGELEQGVVKLVDVSLQLPPEEGGVKLVGVTGDLVFDREGVEIKKLTGRIAEAGKAIFALSGRYYGYEPDSPFEVSAEIRELDLPFGEELAGVWGGSYARLKERLSLSGPVDIQVTVRRDARRPIAVAGSAELRGVSLTSPNWPMRVDDVRGKVLLGGDAMKLMDLHGWYGQAEVTITGQVTGGADKSGYDVRLSARNVPLSKEVRDALPESYRKVWDSFSPRGKAGFVLRQARPAGQAAASTTLTIQLTGGASVEYSGFPYRIDHVEGEAVVDHRGMVIRSVRGRAGPMRCLVSGQVVRKGKHHEVEVRVEEATGVPLDGQLARALPAKARAAYEACGLTGRANVTNAVIRRRGDGPVEFEIPVALTDAGICHRSFPYRVEGATGEVKITPDAVDIEHLVGRHGRAKINLQGRVLLKDPEGGMDLVADATEISLDSELRNALPPEAGAWWDLLAPTGTAVATLNLRKVRPQAAPGQARPADLRTDYRVVVTPRDMRILYRHFPVPLRQLTGKAEIEPGRMRLRAFTGLAGEARVALDGEITVGAKGEQADLSISTGPVALDETFISSLPAGIVGALQLRPGGRAAFSLASLKVRRGAGAATRPSGPPADTQPSVPVAWSWSGSIALDEATLELGLGHKTVTGRIEGRMDCAGPIESLCADASVVLDKMTVGSHHLGKITARVSKSESSPVLSLEEISAKALNGRMAGFARVRLGEPAQYGLSLTVENVELAELLASGRPDSEGQSEFKGLLSGSLRMTGTSGDDSSRRATGTLRVSRGKLYRLPVLLGFLHLIYLTVPSDSAFSSAEVNYYLRGNTLVFREIHLQGSALSMLGAGSMDIKTEKLKLTFLAGPPHKLPRLAMLSEVIEGIASGLVAVRVTGTLSKPNKRAVPLRNPNATLRELYEPDAQ